MMDVPEIIKSRRQEMGIGQRELARLCNFPPSTVNRIEIGKVSPTIKTVSAIFKALNITMEAKINDK